MNQYNNLKAMILNGTITINQNETFECDSDLPCECCPLRIVEGEDLKYLCEHIPGDRDYENMLRFIDNLKETDPEVFL